MFSFTENFFVEELNYDDGDDDDDDDDVHLSNRLIYNFLYKHILIIIVRIVSSMSKIEFQSYFSMDNRENKLVSLFPKI